MNRRELVKSRYTLPLPQRSRSPRPCAGGVRTSPAELGWEAASWDSPVVARLQGVARFFHEGKLYSLSNIETVDGTTFETWMTPNGWSARIWPGGGGHDHRRERRTRDRVA